MASLKVSFSENTEKENLITKQCFIKKCNDIAKYYEEKDKKLLCNTHRMGISCIRIGYICKHRLCNKQALYGTEKKQEKTHRCENHKCSGSIKCSDEVINQAYEEYKKILSYIGDSHITYDTDYDTGGSGYDTEKDLKNENNISSNSIKKEENNLSTIKNQNNVSPNIRKRQENNLYFPKNIINFKKEDIKILKLYKPLDCNLYLSDHALFRCYQRNINIYQIYYEIHNVDIDSKKIYEICVNEKQRCKIPLLTINIIVEKKSENNYILITTYPINENYELDDPPVKETGIQTDNEFYDIIEMFKSNVVSLKKKDISTIECQYNNDNDENNDISTIQQN